MPLPVMHLRNKQTIVKTVNAPNCHCEERSDVAISGRQLQFVQGVDKMHGPIASVAALTAQPLACPLRVVSALQAGNICGMDSTA